MISTWFQTKPKHNHTWQTVAFDTGYYTTYTDTKQKSKHHLRFDHCIDCGARQLVVENSTIGETDNHDGVHRARHYWVTANILKLSNEADVFNYDYQMTSPASHNIRTWEYQPITDLGKILLMLKANDEFQELCKHKVVEDTFNQFETSLKLHENL